MMIWDKSYFDSFGVTDGQTDTQFPHFDQADRIIIRSRETLASLTTDTIQSAIEEFDALLYRLLWRRFSRANGRQTPS